MKGKVMLVGLGSLGGAVLELLAREEGIGPIVACGRDVARGEARCNLARLGALAQDRRPDIRFARIDLDEPEALAAAVRREGPDILFSAATMQTWWLPDLLPAEPAALLRSARLGAWLPVHLALTLKLMKGLQEAGYRGVTLTAPYPDVVNCVLDRLALAPTCGVGNLDEIVPKVRLLAAEKLKVPIDGVTVVLVAHHALEPAVFGEPMPVLPPYFLRVYHDGEDVTLGVGADALLLAPYPLPPGPAWCFLTASSTVRLIRALLSEGTTRLHAPAPRGLPGGYPVVVRRGDVRPAPIDGLTEGEAIAINERSHPFDGIERIEADGTAVFRRATVEVMDRLLGYRCERLAPGDAEERGKELVARFGELAARCGVDLGRSRIGHEMSGATGSATERRACEG